MFATYVRAKSDLSPIPQSLIIDYHRHFARYLIYD